MKLEALVGKTVTVKRERKLTYEWGIEIKGKLRRFTYGYIVQGFSFPDVMIAAVRHDRVGRRTLHTITLRPDTNLNV